MKTSQLILVPAPAAGHIISTIEFAKILIKLDPQLSISVLAIKLPIFPYADDYIKSLTDSEPGINLIYVPPADPLPSEVIQKSVEKFFYDSIDAHKHLVRNIIQQLVSSHVQVVGLVLDLFCPSFTELGVEFAIPTFIFLTCGADFLNLMFYLPSRHQQGAREFSPYGCGDLLIPGFANPVPPRVLPQAVFNKDGGYEAFIQIAEGFHRVSGVIVNTFAELESHAIEWYKNVKHPKVYPVGPVLNLKGHPNPEMDMAERDKVMKWLDGQPESSVVFLCFGSAGSFEAEQLREIALGLEQSGHKFLWAIRFPSLGNQDTQLKTREEMLPEGFLERVQGRGIVCGWAPQVEVLGHRAIRGFVSHCGWNSVLESLWCGVPIATLPMYAEQQLNAFTLVKELVLAVELKLDYKTNDEIGREEVEKAVRKVMESESEVRKKVKEMSKIAKIVQMEGGSSYNSLVEFIGDVRGSNHSN